MRLSWPSTRKQLTHPSCFNPRRCLCLSRRGKPRECRFIQVTRITSPTSQPTWTLNRNSSSSISSVRIGISLHGSPLICLEFQGSWLSISYMLTQRQDQLTSPLGISLSKREKLSDRK